MQRLALHGSWGGGGSENKIVPVLGYRGLVIPSNDYFGTPEGIWGEGWASSLLFQQECGPVRLALFIGKPRTVMTWLLLPVSGPNEWKWALQMMHGRNKVPDTRWGRVSHRVPYRKRHFRNAITKANDRDRGSMNTRNSVRCFLST